MRSPVYSPYDYTIHEDPYPTYDRLREEAPLYRNEELDFWALSRHADVAQSFRDYERYSSINGVSLDASSWSPYAHRVMSILALDPPRHTRLRALVSKGFTPRRVRELHPRILELTRQHLEPALEKGTFDYVADFAGLLPMDVISELMGVPVVDRAELRRLADLTVHREEGLHDVPQAGMEATLTLVAYYSEMLALRRKRPTDDLTSALLTAEIDGDRLDDREIIAFLFLMVVAGNETTTKLLANSLYWAWKHGLGPRVLNEPVDAWVEETLRYDTSSQQLARTVATDLTLYGQTVPAGSRLLLLIGAANRDPRVFPRPEVYDLDRDTSQIISFGAGRHYCLGANMARLETQIALTELTARISSYEIDEDASVRVHSSNVRGFATLPLTVTLRLSPLRRQVVFFPPHPSRRPAVVAGASSGIGAATALLLASAGHPVALGARRTEKCAEIADLIHSAGGEAFVHPLDVGDGDSVKAFAAAAIDALGSIEVLVSGAGTLHAERAADVSAEVFLDQVNVHLVGAHRLVSQFAPLMVLRQRGDIVFISSDVVRAPRPLVAAYVAAKSGVEGLARTMQMELEGTGVRTSLVRPGPTATEMGTGWDAEITTDVLESWIGWGLARHSHFLQPSDVAAAVLAVVGTPRGSHLTLVEVQPEGPLS